MKNFCKLLLISILMYYSSISYGFIGIIAIEQENAYRRRVNADYNLFKDDAEKGSQACTEKKVRFISDFENLRNKISNDYETYCRSPDSVVLSLKFSDRAESCAIAQRAKSCLNKIIADQYFYFLDEAQKVCQEQWNLKEGANIEKYQSKVQSLLHKTKSALEKSCKPTGDLKQDAIRPGECELLDTTFTCLQGLEGEFNNNTFTKKISDKLEYEKSKAEEAADKKK